MALVTRFVYSLWLLGVPGLAFMSTFRRSIRSANAYTLRATTIGVETNTGPKSIAPLKEACAGAVLIAHPGEYSHYLMQACVFLFEGGPDRGYQGVILESPTSFTIGEMAAAAVGEELGRNTLFTGGEDGEDTAIMLSSHDMGGLTRPCGERSNVFVGGLGAAKRLVESGAAPASDFKFFFRSCIWEKGILEKEVETGRWMVAEVPMTDVLTQRPIHSLWARTRAHIKANYPKEFFIEAEEEDDVDAYREEKTVTQAQINERGAAAAAAAAAAFGRGDKCADSSSGIFGQGHADAQASSEPKARERNGSGI